MLTLQSLVEHAERMVDEHGFRALKLKAAVLEPEAETAGLEAPRFAFPDAPLGIDPNGAWHVRTTLVLLPRLEDLLDYLEGPTLGM